MNLHPSRLPLSALAILLLLALSSVATLAAADQTLDVQHYVNTRFGYELSYPAMLVPQGEADNRDGQRFVSHDAEATLLVWGSHNVFDDSIATLFRRESQTPERTVTYSVVRDRFFVLSGFAGEDIFYTKTIHDSQTDTFATFHFTYPRQRKKEFDPVVAILSKSFRHHNQTGLAP